MARQGLAHILSQTLGVAVLGVPFFKKNWKAGFGGRKTAPGRGRKCERGGANRPSSTPGKVAARRPRGGCCAFRRSLHVAFAFLRGSKLGKGGAHTLESDLTGSLAAVLFGPDGDTHDWSLHWPAVESRKWGRDAARSLAPNLAGSWVAGPCGTGQDTST